MFSKRKVLILGDYKLLRVQFCSYLANIQWKAKVLCWSNKCAFSASPAICFFLLLSYGIHWANEYSFIILDPEADASNYDQFNNSDFLCTMENCENGDELYFCSNTIEAYARIGMKEIFVFWIIIFQSLAIAISYKFYFQSKAVAYTQVACPSCMVGLARVPKPLLCGETDEQ